MSTCKCGEQIETRETAYGDSWMHTRRGATLCADGTWPSPVCDWDQGRYERGKR